jgi:Tol biopolymer transport system component
MRADGSGRSQLLSSVHPESPAVWSPDSQQLVIIIQDGDQELTRINRDGSGFMQLTNNTANDWGPVWEPQ